MNYALPDPSKPLGEQPADVLLAMCLYGEARGEGKDGMLGVANVIRNRVFAPRNTDGKRFGSGYAGVILRPGAFDCMRPRDVNFRKLVEPLKYEREGVWVACYGVAADVMGGASGDNTLGATHYYDCSICAPCWARPEVIKAGRITPTVTIGRLRFFREP